MLDQAEREVRDAQARLDAIGAADPVDEVPQLPTNQDVRDRVLALDKMADDRPAALREALRTLVKGARITMTPVPERGVYEARAEVLPGVLLINAKKPTGTGPGGLSVNTDGCGGAISPLANVKHIEGFCPRDYARAAEPKT